jgi:hypothetical protein
VGRTGAQLAVVLVAASTLVAASAFAAHGSKPPPKLTVGARYWEVGVNGQSYKVPASGRLKYCASAKLEAMTPIVHLKAKKAAPNFYAWKITGPKGALQTAAAEARFSGRTTVLNVAVPPSAFTHGLKRADGNREALPAGTYELSVFQDRVPLEGSLKPLMRQTITLAPKAGC